MYLRIKQVRLEKGLTLDQLAERVGVSTGYLQRMEAGVRATNTRWLTKIAEALGVQPKDLLSRPVPGRMIEIDDIKVIGAVQAGYWVEAMEWPQEQQYSIAVPKPAEARKAFGLVVNGPSMNKVFKNGCILICVSLMDFWRDLKSDDYVIVQKRDANDLIEATVKQLVIDQTGRAWLWPRSDDPEFQQPVNVPWPAETEFPDDNRDIGVTAVVVGFYQGFA